MKELEETGYKKGLLMWTGYQEWLRWGRISVVYQIFLDTTKVFMIKMLVEIDSKGEYNEVSSEN